MNDPLLQLLDGLPSGLQTLPTAATRLPPSHFRARAVRTGDFASAHRHGLGLYNEAWRLLQDTDRDA